MADKLVLVGGYNDWEFGDVCKRSHRDLFLIEWETMENVVSSVPFVYVYSEPNSTRYFIPTRKENNSLISRPLHLCVYFSSVAETRMEAINSIECLSSVQFRGSVMSDSLWPHESQHAWPPCPSPTSGVHPNSCALSWWCHPAISSSVVPFSSCPQSLPASESFPMSQLFAWGG